MYNRSTEDKLLRFKKILAFIASVGMFGISVWFSQRGFGIESNSELLWIGWFLGITVNIIELVFNTNVKKLNPTLIAAGIMAYAYGLYTNFVGFYGIMNSGIFSAIIGIFVEILPEPLFAWSIGVAEGGDVVGNIAELFGSPAPVQPPKPQFPKDSLMHQGEQQKTISPIFSNSYTQAIKNKKH